MSKESLETRFGTRKVGGFKVLLGDQPEAETLLALLLPDPDRHLASGEVFKPGSRTHAVRIELDGRSYFLKRYNCRGLWYRLRNAVRPSRAQKTWINTWEFIRRGVDVAKPIVMLEERRFRFLGRSYILMEFVEESERLRSLWPRLDKAARESLLSSLGRILGRMHRAGCLHGDLKWDNILVGRSGDRLSIRLVDMDGSRVPGDFRRARAEKDLARCLQDLESNSSGSEKGILLKAWGEALGEAYGSWQKD